MSVSQESDWLNKINSADINTNIKLNPDVSDVLSLVQKHYHGVLLTEKQLTLFRMTDHVDVGAYNSNNEIIGYLMCLFFNIKKSNGSNTTWMSTTFLTVRPDYRNQSIALQMMKVVAEYGNKLGYRFGYYLTDKPYTPYARQITEMYRPLDIETCIKAGISVKGIRPIKEYHTNFEYNIPSRSSLYIDIDKVSFAHGIINSDHVYVIYGEQDIKVNDKIQTMAIIYDSNIRTDDDMEDALRYFAPRYFLLYYLGTGLCNMHNMTKHGWRHCNEVRYMDFYNPDLLTIPDIRYMLPV